MEELEMCRWCDKAKPHRDFAPSKLKERQVCRKCYEARRKELRQDPCPPRPKAPPMPEPHPDPEIQAILGSVTDLDLASRSKRDHARDVEIICREATGLESQPKIAADLGVHPQTVKKTVTKFREEVDGMQNLFRKRVLEQMLADQEEMTDALATSVKNSENKNQPGAAKALGDWGGLMNRRQDVHIGDNFNQLNLDQSQHLAIQNRTPEEAEARRLELERRFLARERGTAPPQEPQEPAGDEIGG